MVDNLINICYTEVTISAKLNINKHIHASTSLASISIISLYILAGIYKLANTIYAYISIYVNNPRPPISY